MRPLAPKMKKTKTVQFEISSRSQKLIKYYSEYSGYSESEIIDDLISQFMDCDDFVNYLESKRYTKTIQKEIFQGKSTGLGRNEYANEKAN